MEALIDKILEEISKNLDPEQSYYLETLNRLLSTLLMHRSCEASKNKE